VPGQFVEAVIGLIPVDALYPILYLDALQVKLRSQGSVRNKAIYLAFGVGMNGLKEVLGIWSSDNEGAKLWMQVITELKTRGVQDIFIACVDAVSKVFLKPSKRFIQTRRFNCASCIWFGTLCFTSRTKTAKKWRAI